MSANSLKRKMRQENVADIDSKKSYKMILRTWITERKKNEQFFWQCHKATPIIVTQCPAGHSVKVIGVGSLSF